MGEVPHNLLVFDPGVHTGWSLFVDGAFKQGGEVLELSSVGGLILAYSPTLVIYEGYRLFPGMAQRLTGSRFEPAEVIGVIRYLCAVSDIEIIEQMPNVKEFFMPVGRLHYYNVFVDSEHARDAARHGLYYLVFKLKALGVPKEEHERNESADRGRRSTRGKDGGTAPKTKGSGGPLAALTGGKAVRHSPPQKADPVGWGKKRE